MFAIATVISYARFHFPLYFSSIRYSKQQTQVAYLLKTARDYLTGAVCCHAICHKSFIFLFEKQSTSDVDVTPTHPPCEWSIRLQNAFPSHSKSN